MQSPSRLWEGRLPFHRLPRRILDPGAAVLRLLIDIEVDDLVVGIEAVDRDDVLADEFCPARVAFLDFLKSDAARDLIERAGYGVPSQP